MISHKNTEHDGKLNLSSKDYDGQGDPKGAVDAKVLTAIQRFEEGKEDSRYDHLLSSNADLLIRAMKAAGLTRRQIRCASKTEQNKVIIRKVIEHLAKKGISINVEK